MLTIEILETPLLVMTKNVIPNLVNRVQNDHVYK